MKFGITGNSQKEEFFRIAWDIYQRLTPDHEFILADNIIQQDTEFRKLNVKTAHIAKIADTCDIILSIGGDGTILSTARMIGDKSIPILGIHIGRLGFLTECMQSDYQEGINDILSGNYSITERLLLKAEVINRKQQTLHALNDIIIEHGTARILRTHVHVSGEYLNSYESDGVIFSTPTGSTAYSLSAGGPIISPNLDVITVTPICPHSLSARPIVIPPDETITISFDEEQAGMTLTVDGQISIPVDFSTKITLSRASYCVKMVNFPNKTNFFETLRKKLGWSGNVR